MWQSLLSEYFCFYVLLCFRYFFYNKDFLGFLTAKYNINYSNVEKWGKY